MSSEDQKAEYIITGIKSKPLIIKPLYVAAQKKRMAILPEIRNLISVFVISSSSKVVDSGVLNKRALLQVISKSANLGTCPKIGQLRIGQLRYNPYYFGFYDTNLHLSCLSSSRMLSGIET